MNPHSTRYQATLAVQHQRPHQLLNLRQLMPFHTIHNPIVNFFTDERIIKQRRTHTHRLGTGDQKLNGVIGGADATLTDDGNAMRLTHLMYLMRF